MELILKNKLTEMDALAAFVRRFSEQHAISEKTGFQLNLALEELIANIISYGYEDDADHTIQLRIRRQGDLLTAEIRDDARPFNPEERPTPDLEAPLKDRPIGGLGIHLVREMFDTMQYTRQNDQNHLVITKSLATKKTL